MALPTRESFLASGLRDVMETEAQDAPDRECAICWGSFDQPVATPCQHMFCSGCIRIWLAASHSCPACSRHLYERPEVPLEHPTDIEALELEVDVDERAVIEILIGINSSQTENLSSSDTIVAPEDMVFVDRTTILPRAVAAAIWIKLDTDYSRRSLDDVCRAEWVKVVNGFAQALEKYNQQTMPASYFRAELSLAVWARAAGGGRSRAVPEYASQFEDARTFRSDVEHLLGVIVECAAKLWQEGERERNQW